MSDQPTNLKKMIDSRGLKQKWLAEKLDVTEDTMSRWGNGETLPNLEAARRLAHLFGCSIDDLFPSE